MNFSIIFENIKNYMKEFDIKKFLKKLDKFTYPSKPYKRNLSNIENDFLRENFGNEFTWFNFVDNKGRIFLNKEAITDNKIGGDFYIKEDDLQKLFYNW